jgi:imidazolonepropionase-like amidohydrolase
MSLPRGVCAVTLTTLATVSALVALAGCSRGPRLIEVADEPSALVVRNTTVLDVVSGRRLRGRDVVVVAGRILTVARHGSEEIRRATAGMSAADLDEIDGAGGTLLPGLIDMHAHPGTSAAPHGDRFGPDPLYNLRAYLFCGVTTVADLGGIPSRALGRRANTASAAVAGPTLYVAGPAVTAPGGHPVPILEMVLPGWLRWYVLPRYVRQVETATEATDAVDGIADAGADFLKVIVDRIPPDAPRLDDGVLAAAVAHARTRGLRSIAHVGTTEDALDAARAGVAAWAHVVYRERIPDDRIAELASFGIPMIPTIVVFESMAARGEESPPSRLEREIATARMLEPGPVPDDPFFEQSTKFLRSRRADWYENVRRLHEGGVVILAGSDMQAGVFPGAGLHRELNHLHRAGLSAIEVVRAATLYPARFLEQTEDPAFGVLAAGKRADLLLVDGDPLADLGALERIRTVVVGGREVIRRPIVP